MNKIDTFLVVSYQVIARKYRPKRFSEVIGQDHVVQALKNSIKLGRVAHAYIFCGPRGTGKTTIARIFSKCLNCTTGPSVDYPDNDPRCIEIDEGRSLDVLEIDGASNNGVDQVRELRETVRFPPVNSRFKIYIIDEVHMLTTAAFNALLKTLEEPPPFVKFFFATTDPEKVLPTILSRCQRFDLRRIPASLIVGQLSWIAKQEGVEATPGALHTIARYADGCLRDALSALDQLISFCGEKITEEDVENMFGLPSKYQVFQIVNALFDGNYDRLIEIVDQLEREARELTTVLTNTIHCLHDLLIMRLTHNKQGFMFISETDTEEITKLLSKIKTDSLLRMIETLIQAEGRIRYVNSKRIAFELALLKACELREAINIPEILRQLQELKGFFERTTSKPSSSTPEKTSMLVEPTSSKETSTPSYISKELTSARVEKTNVTEADNTNSLGVSSKDGLETDGKLWASLLENLTKRRVAVVQLLQKASKVKIEANKVIIVFSEEFREKIPLLQTPRVVGMLKKVLKDLTGSDYEIRFELEASLNSIAPSVDQLKSKVLNNNVGSPEKLDGLNQEEFLKDPVIKEALEIFKAKIVKSVPIPNDKTPETL